MDKGQKKKICQLAVVMLYSSFCLHMTFWLCMVQLRAIWFGVVQFSTSYMNFKTTSHI